MKDFLDIIGYFGWGFILGYFWSALYPALKKIMGETRHAHKTWDKSQ